VEASGPGAVAVGGDNTGTITTTVIMPGGRAGIWLETDRFFVLQSGASLYSHDWTLVGRGPELHGLVEWLTGDGRSVALLDGRGGIGKSRLLRAFADAAATEHGYLVRFLDRSVSVQPGGVEVLPSADRLLVIVDDAHESPGVATTVAGIRRARPTAKILLATRPYGLDHLLRDLRAAGLHRIDVPHWRLEDLSVAEATDLAGAVLGAGYDEDVARRLAATGRDCPLIIVVGGGLIRQGMLDADRVTNDDLLRDEVMATFAKALTADAAVADPSLRREVLHAVAALQPFRLNEPEFRAAAEGLTGRAFDQVLPEVRELENAGVLLRRENAVRIVPDLLGDTLLADAIVDIRSGAGTGYLERILRAVDGDALLHLVLNASRVDWNVRHAAPEPRPSLVDALWDALVARFKAAGAEERLTLLRRLRRVIFYQPAALLTIGQIAYESSAASDGDPLLRDEIRAALPPVLEKAALDPDHFSASVDLLWELAGQDGQTDRQQPDHPLQVLKELAEFKPWKPLAFNARMVESVKRWIAASRGSRPAVSPLDILQPLLATEATEQESDGIRLTLKQFQLDRAAVSPLRREAVNLVLNELGSPDRWAAARAAEALEKSLQYPHGFHGHTVPTEQREAWTPDFVETLGRLRDLITTRPIDPVVAVAVRRSLRWHARHARGATKAAARAVLDALPNGIEYEIAVALHDGWGHLLDEVDNFREAQRVQAEKLESLARRALAKWSENALLDELANGLQAEQDAALTGRQANPEPLAHALMRNRPSLAQALIASVIREPENPLAVLLPVAVQALLRSEADAGWELVDTLLRRDHLGLTRLTASGLSRYRGDQGPVDAREQAALRRLLRHEDDTTRRLALHAVRWIGEYDRASAAELVLSVSFEHSPPVAEEVLSAFGEHGYLSYDDVGDADRERLLTGIARLATIEEYAAQAFLAGLSAVNPEAVLRLLKRRAMPGTEPRAADYRALPDHWQENLRFRGPARFSEFLWDALEWVAENIEDAGIHDRGALFAAVAVTFDDEVRDMLCQALETGVVQHIRAVGEVLAHAHRTLVWEHPNFVVRVLRAAEEHGDECRRDVWRGLYRSVWSGGLGGPVGEPFPQDVEQRDRSRAVAATLAEGSPERAFYDALADTAEAAIRSEIDHERHFLEHRDW
jgi:predicted transcriptional regulator